MTKRTVLRDDMKITGGGIYSYTPFQEFDPQGKGVYKIGLSNSIDKRIDGYHTEFPLGMWIGETLHKIPADNGKTIRDTLKEVEKYIYNEILKLGGKAIHTTTRVRNPNVDGTVNSEWIYAHPTAVKSAFKLAHKKYKGTLVIHTFTKQDMIKDKKVRLSKPHYSGEIIYNFV